MSVSVDDLVERARRRIRRVGPHELEGLVAEGGLVVDIRPAEQRGREGELPGAVVVERNVLEWRLDPASEHRLPQVRDLHQPVVVVCSAGYASSLAAASARGPRLHAGGRPRRRLPSVEHLVRPPLSGFARWAR